jgi:hypothetical protein
MSKAAFQVPNTVTGRNFIKNLRKYATPGQRVVVRGRGPRKWIAHFSQYAASTPLNKATGLAVYLP